MTVAPRDVRSHPGAADPSPALAPSASGAESAPAAGENIRRVRPAESQSKLPAGVPSSFSWLAGILVVPAFILAGEFYYLVSESHGSSPPALLVGLPLVGIGAIVLAILTLRSRHAYLVELGYHAERLSQSRPPGAPGPGYTVEVAAAGIEAGTPFPVRSDDEAGYLAAGLNRLIAGRRSSFDECQQRNAVLHRILGSVEAGIILADSAGRIVYLNPAAGRLLGRHERDILGKTVLESTLRNDLDDAVTGAALRSESAAVSLVLNHTGQHVSARVSPFGPQRSGAVVVLQDREEQARLESVRRDFIANVSHELRTPLASIRAMAETLASGASDDTAVAAQFLEIIIRESDRLARLTDDILDLARYESGRLESEPVDLAELLRDVAQQFHAKAVQAGLQFNSEIEPLPMIAGDRSALRQVLLNLLENAVKYTTEGSVTLRASVAAPGSNRSRAGALAGERVRIDVIDTGPGMAPEHLPRIFERFYRVDRARSREQGGTGLGLSIARHVTEAHGGKIEVASIPGHGSTFTVWLPS